MSHSVLRVDHHDDDSAREPITQPIDTHHLTLSQPLGTSTWLGILDNTLVTARLVTSPGHLPSLDQPITTQSHLRSPRHLVPFIGTQVVDMSVWSVSEFVPGVSLDRLLGLAILTPAQATYLASAIFGGLAELHAAGLVHGALTTRAVVIGTDGRARLAGWIGASSGLSATDEDRTADLEAACGVVFELARNADRPVSRHNPGAARLLVQLERLGTGGTPAAAAVTAQRLSDSLAAAEGLQTGEMLLQGQVAALSNASAKNTPALDRGAAAARRAGRGRTTRRVPAQIEQPAARRSEAQRPGAQLPQAPLSQADWRGPRRRRLMWVAALVLVLLASVGYVVARKPISSFADRVLGRHPATSTASSGAPKGDGARRAANLGNRNGLRAVPRLAPAAAGIVRQVSLRPTAACRPNRACPVRVTIRIKPTSSTHALTWRIVLVNRCTGSRSTRARGTMIVSPGSTTAYATRRIKLPAARALAAVAVTTKPAQAASRPLLVPARAASC